MEELYFHEIILETSITIMEIIQEHQQAIAMTRVMQDGIAVFTFHKVLPSATTMFAECKLRPAPYLSTDLQNLFLTFYQMIKCTEANQ